MGWTHYLRIDLSQQGPARLAPETRSRLASLPEPVRVIITMPRDSESKDVARIYRDLERLLREMQYASRRDGRDFLEVEFVDIFRQRRRAMEIAREHGLEQENAILVTSGIHQRTIPGTDLYRIRDGEPEAFLGEQVFLGAILDVINPSEQTIYFLTGHAEMRIDDPDPFRGLTRYRQALMERNVRVRSLDLTRVPTIPEDADLVIMAAPQVPLLRSEVEKIRNYLGNQEGRMMIFLEPDLTHGMRDLLLDWGILSEDMRVIEREAGSRAEGGDLILRRFADHPITDFLIQFQLATLASLPRPVLEDPGAPEESGLRITPLIFTSEESWATRNQGSRANTFDEAADRKGPLSVGVLSEKVTGSDLGIQLPGGKLAVFGTADLISNNRINSLGNRILATNAAFWMLERDQFMNIPPRQIQSLQITLSETQQRQFLLWLLIIPGTTLLAGGFIALIRR